MQMVWSRSVRPQTTCRYISGRNPLPSTLSRRTTTGIFKKRLSAGDAFTLLLGPVLGGAYILDARAKERKRREWDNKIAEVQAEVEEIRRSGTKKYNIRGPNFTRFPASTRCYSTAAIVSPALQDDEDPIETLELPAPAGPDEMGMLPADITDNQGTAYTNDQEFSRMQTESKLDQATWEKCKRLQRLVAIKLALRMILHIHIGKSPRYIFSDTDYVYDTGRLPRDVNDLIQHLKQITNSLKMMNGDELRSSWRAYQSVTRGKTCSLDAKICEIVHLFRKGEMNVTNLVESFAEGLLSTSESPTVHGYIPLLNALSRARFDELCYMIDGTMIEAQIPYDRNAVFILLWLYGKNREAHHFDRLIKKLTTDNAKARFGEQWVWRNIRGTSVPMPPSQDPQILQILIYTALKCNQPHRAEAWSTLLSWTQNSGKWFSHVTCNFLRYHSAHRNWQKGHEWLKIALERSELFAAEGIRHLQRVAYAMLDFCVAHDERSLYRDILKAAAESRLGVYSADPNLTLTKRAVSILNEWESCHNQKDSGSPDTLTPIQKAEIFHRKLRHFHHLERPSETGDPDSMDSVNVYKGSRPARPNKRPAQRDLKYQNGDGQLPPEEASTGSNASNFVAEREANHWKEICRKQQAELDSLKHQLATLKSLHGSAGANRDEISSRLAKEVEVEPPLSRDGDIGKTTAQPVAEEVEESIKMTPVGTSSSYNRPETPERPGTGPTERANPEPAQPASEREPNEKPAKWNETVPLRPVFSSRRPDILLTWSPGSPFQTMNIPAADVSQPWSKPIPVRRVNSGPRANMHTIVKITATRHGHPSPPLATSTSKLLLPLPSPTASQIGSLP